MPYRKHTNIKSINNNSRIWRYITLARLISLLERKQLYMHNIRKQEDPFEGRYSAADFEPEKNPAYKLAYLNANMDIRTEKAKFINCWHINDYESLAMWELYTNKQEGIAIQSTFGGLKKSFKNTQGDIYIGKVDYKDRRHGLTEIAGEKNMKVNFTKDKSYEFERELRVFLYLDYLNEASKANKKIWKEAIARGGIYVDIELDDILEHVYISPFAAGWFVEVVNGIMKKYGVNGEKVKKSHLSEKPLY